MSLVNSPSCILVLALTVMVFLPYIYDVEGPTQQITEARV